MQEESVRLNKFISSGGRWSRREADRLIEEGQVRVNGAVAKIGTAVTSEDRVEVQGERIRSKKPKERIYMAFNKPEGITCTTEEDVKGNIIKFLKLSTKVFPIGRLDKFSQGLIFLTNDGDIVNKILRAGNDHEKEYMITVDRLVSDEFVRKMANGVSILGTITQKCKVVKQGTHGFRITLKQGLNRQIRRMCEQLGYNVSSLQRIRIMNVSLGKLKVGAWRHLTHAEMEEINGLIEDSSNTQEASFDPNKSKKKHFEKQEDYMRTNAKTSQQRKKVTRGRKSTSSKRTDTGRPVQKGKGGRPVGGKPTGRKSNSAKGKRR